MESKIHENLLSNTEKFKYFYGEKETLTKCGDVLMNDFSITRLDKPIEHYFFKLDPRRYTVSLTKRLSKYQMPTSSEGEPSPKSQRLG